MDPEAQTWRAALPLFAARIDEALASMRALGRAEYAHVDDTAALAAFGRLARLEGILPALESAHAVAYAETVARELGPSKILLVNLSGRGDKDVQTVEKHLAANC
jgi:tryptophan synthase beta chain